MNRTLKRPMFRIGGQVNQGSGIMSHVEPKNYMTGGRVMAAGGYDPRGTYFGYGADPRGTYFGPSSGTTGTSVSQTPGMFDPYNVSPANVSPATTSEAEKISTFEKGQAARRAAMNKALQFGKYFPAIASTASQYGAGILGPALPAVAGLGLGYGRSKLIDYRNELIGDLEKVRSGVDIKKPANYKETTPTGSLLAYRNLTAPGTITTAINENGDLVDRSTGELLNREPGNTDKPPVQPKPAAKDPKQQIREEADFIRDLIKDEDTTTAEAAFVLARAIATPGGIGEKVKAANELLIPMAKDKSKIKKDITLEAYKSYKEKQLEEIKAGKLSDWGKASREAAENAKLAGDTRPIAEIIKEYNDLKFGDEKYTDKIIAASKMNDLSIIVGKVKSIREVEDRIENKEKVDKADKILYEKNKKEVERFKLDNPEIFKKYFGAKADGGRIGFAYGSPEPEQPQIKSTTLNEGGDEIQLKPVVKLSYQELRTRLPKEISDNIVLLLSNSDQALQEFAYITTQQDINEFNVKYGVNLVLPSNK